MHVIFKVTGIRRNYNSCGKWINFEIERERESPFKKMWKNFFIREFVWVFSLETKLGRKKNIRYFELLQLEFLFFFCWFDCTSTAKNIWKKKGENLLCVLLLLFFEIWMKLIYSKKGEKKTSPLFLFVKTKSVWLIVIFSFSLSLSLLLIFKINYSSSKSFHLFPRAFKIIRHKYRNPSTSIPLVSFLFLWGLIKIRTF